MAAESELPLAGAGVPRDVLSAVRANSVRDAAPAGDRRSRPLVVLRGGRALDITRAYVRAFFDQHPRGIPQALLERASPRLPEVMFCPG